MLYKSTTYTISSIRFRGLWIALSLVVMFNLSFIQGRTDNLSALEIPVSLLAGPALSVQKDVSSDLEPAYTQIIAKIQTSESTESYQLVDPDPLFDTDPFLSSLMDDFPLYSLPPPLTDQKEIESSSSVSSDTQPGPEDLYNPIILEAANRCGVDPAIIKAIIKAESGYNPKAVSNRGARGLMQLMPNTAKELGVEDSFCPVQNIYAGVEYFKRLLDRFSGNTKLALAAYNAGSRKVRKYKGVPPFKTTKLYIKKVFEYHRHYKQQMTENG